MADYPRLDDNGLLYYTEQVKQKIEDSVPDDMTGASDVENGKHGLVPQPNAGQNGKFLRGDGVWADPIGTENTIETISVNGTNVPADEHKNVNIVIPDAPVQSISINGAEVTPDADGTVAFDVPTATSDITNDSDFQTGTQVDNKIASAVSSVYKPGPSVAFANLPALSASNLGYIYNITDAFTTTSDFVEGAGIEYSAGTDVAIIDTGTNENPVYKYNAFVNTSVYVKSSEMTTISNATIDTIIATAFGE